MPVIQQEAGKNWTLFNGDCCEVIKDLPDESIDFTIYSPPFSTLYIYSDSNADMGNCADNTEFFEHYKFLLPDLLRVTSTGRICAVHCKDLPKYANRDGTAGLFDFPGQLIEAHVGGEQAELDRAMRRIEGRMAEAAANEDLKRVARLDGVLDNLRAELFDNPAVNGGWSFHSRVTIWKCPVTERERTNNNGLLHKTVTRDRSQLRQGMADYLLMFRKAPVDTLMAAKPITRDVPGVNGFGQYIGDVGPTDQEHHPSAFCRKTRAADPSIDIWRRYAEPVWWDVNQTNVLNCKRKALDNGERHICPLQLDVIERACQIWSEPDDVVLSPFAGYGSEGVGAMKIGRRFIGIELSAEYFIEAAANLRAAEESTRNMRLF